jgi:splicing factor 3B subunit 4
VSYDSFESSDQALFWPIVVLLYFGTLTFAVIFQANNQHLCNRPITVLYAYKKDTKGERHGTPTGIVF